MTCKDCLHYEICADFKRNICDNCNEKHNEYVINKDGICDKFKDRTKFIKLPCKVGDTVYIIGEKYRCGKYEKYINTGKFRLSDIEKFGETVFINKEDAEKALKERESNEQIY